MDANHVTSIIMADGGMKEKLLVGTHGSIAKQYILNGENHTKLSIPQEASGISAC